MKTRRVTWLGMLGLTLGGALSAASGREASFEWAQSGTAEFEDAAGVSMKQSAYTVQGASFTRGKGGQFAVDGSYSWVDVDWRGNPLPGEDAPLYDRAEIAAVSALWTRGTGAELGFSVFASVEAARARGSIFESVGMTDAIGYRLGGTLNFRRDAGLVVGVGVLFTPAVVETDREWLPILQVYWPINDKWTLQTRNGVVLSWRNDPTESQTLSMSALWNSQEWHLGEQDGVEYSLENEGLSLGIRYGFNTASRGRALSGAIMGACLKAIWTDS
jgi:hypothetical protein